MWAFFFLLVALTTMKIRLLRKEIDRQNKNMNYVLNLLCEEIKTRAAINVYMKFEEEFEKGLHSQHDFNQFILENNYEQELARFGIESDGSNSVMSTLKVLEKAGEFRIVRAYMARQMNHHTAAIHQILTAGDAGAGIGKIL